jgi:hypothetical protein
MLLKATDGIRGAVWDIDTGRRVPKVIELDTERGYLKAYFVVKQDDCHPEREVERRNFLGEAEWYEAYGRFKFVPEERKTISTKTVMGAFVCARCPSTLTLPGDELCPHCRAEERGQRNRFAIERLTTPLFNRRCESCSRLATFSVADEVDVTPLQKDRYLYERGMTVGRRYYCSQHYRPARLLDSKGEVVKDFRYAGPDVATLDRKQGYEDS